LCVSPSCRIAIADKARAVIMSRHGPVETAFLGVHRLLARDEADPVASGWSGCRVGIAPTGKRRLVTAHANSGHSATASPID
jgi:hypothetical protein